jgi:hypothetical protein
VGAGAASGLVGVVGAAAGGGEQAVIRIKQGSQGFTVQLLQL